MKHVVIPADTILVALDKKIIASLLTLCTPEETMSDTISRVIKQATTLANGQQEHAQPLREKLNSNNNVERDKGAEKTQNKALTRKHGVAFLGEIFAADTLPDVYERIVDWVYRTDPAAIERLAKMRARTRKFVSHQRDDIHPYSPHLPVRRTRTGWWISENIGKSDLERGLKALAKAAGLKYGTDIQLLA